MKKIQLLVTSMFLFAITVTVTAQVPDTVGPPGPIFVECVDFDDNTFEGWQSNDQGGMDFGIITDLQAPGPSGANTDIYLWGRDASGLSYYFNDANLTGDWIGLTNGQNTCFCWDYNLITDGEPNSVLPSRNAIGIVNSTSSTDPINNNTARATFRLNVAIDETADWTTLCAPIGFCDAQGNLPSNQYGQWEMANGGDCNDWNQLIRNVTHTILFIDLYGGITETMGWDNFCFKECEQLDIPQANCELVNASGQAIIDDRGNCCQNITLTNNDNISYNEVTFTITTPNVEYNQFSITPTTGLSANSNFARPERTRSILAPNNMPTGTLSNLVEMCFSGANNTSLPPTVDVRVSWLQPLGQGSNIVACEETITLFCDAIPPEPEMGCCDSLENIIVNGDFEFGPEGFETEYQFENDISVSSILPGSYGVVSTEEANSICDNWMVDDHTTNCDGAGNFLVVNGQTGQPGQPGSSIFWGQTIQVDDTTDTYKLCASFKHLEQCCFDVTPTIDVIINGVVVETVTVDQSIGADPCSWQEYTYSFSPDNFSVTIQFALDETALGDGNDLAVDDIIIHNLPKAPFYISTQDQRPQTSNIMASINSINPNGDDFLPSDECEYEWFIAKIDNIVFDAQGNATPSYFPATMQMGGSVQTPNWGLTTDFAGYQAQAGNTSTISGTQPGDFDNGFYLISLKVFDCECYADSTDAKIVGRFAGKVINEEISELNISKEALKELEVIKESFSNGTMTGTTLSPIEATSLLSIEKEKAVLAQNEPNPFDNSTTISYFLPDNSQSAVLRITGIDGSVLQTIPIEQKGTGRVRINSTRYMEGVYFYSLVIDDLVVETKRMVLTR